MAELKPCPFCGGEADCNNSGFMKDGKPMWAVECLTCGVVTELCGTAEEATEAWEKRTEPVQSWTPVAERLPEKRRWCLCYFKYEPESPDVICENFHYGTGGWLSEGSRVTHWMPLPKPPKEQEAGE